MRLIWIALLAARLSAQMVPPILPPTLKDVLNLTSDQAQKITASFNGYATYRRTANTRMAELNSDLSFQFSQPAPDPAQIGADYAEAETIRRGLAAQQAAYRTQVLAVLNPSQLMQYRALLNSIALQPLIGEASCAFLEDSGPSFAIGIFSIPAPTLRIVDFVDIPGFVSVVLPYIPPPPVPTFCGSPLFPLALREYLNATDAEIAAIAQASMDYNDIYQRRQNRIADVQVEIRDESAKEQPDPLQLGVRYIELQLISRDLQREATELRQKARAALTGDQAAKLKSLDDLTAAQPALSVLQGCDLLATPPASQAAPSSIVTGQFIFDGAASCRVM
ncbi:MAG: hypothetical protein ACR2I2_09855 [Bryobacteraceae bacterium]